jgi:hypothetical protein
MSDGPSVRLEVMITSILKEIKIPIHVQMIVMMKTLVISIFCCVQIFIIALFIKVLNEDVPFMAIKYTYK